MQDLSREALLDRLMRFDEEAALRHGTNTRFSIVIVGGGALLLTGMIPRMTHDIDALTISRELYSFMGAYDINAHVSAYMDAFPAGVMDRVQLLPDIHGKVIDFFTASLEDIVIAKIHAYRDPDVADIESPSVLQSLDWEQLHILAGEESQIVALNERAYQEFRSRFGEYERRFRPK